MPKQNKWSFINLAWKDEIELDFPIYWQKILINEKEFFEIEKNIKSLLNQSFENFLKLRPENPENFKNRL